MRLAGLFNPCPPTIALTLDHRRDLGDVADFKIIDTNRKFG